MSTAEHQNKSLPFSNFRTWEDEKNIKSIVVSDWHSDRTEAWEVLQFLAEFGMISDFLILDDSAHLIAVFDTK